jgi:hypothetical protein
MIAFGVYAGWSALTHASGRIKAGQLIAGMGFWAAGLAFMSATWQEWRRNVPLTRNPRAVFGSACILMGTLGFLLLR